MANQALNQVPEVQESIINNVKCFLAVMNDGSIQQMSKELMAQVLEGLLPLATKDKDGLLSKKSAPYTIQFSNSDIVLTFDNIFAFQPFMIACYFNGTFSTYIVNPITYNRVSDFKVRYIGRIDIEIYAKIGDKRIFIKTNGTENGEINIQPLYMSRGILQSVNYGTTPDDFTKIDIVEM